MINIDLLIDNIDKYQNISDINDFKTEILKRYLYFFVINDGSFKSVTEIVWTSKTRPVTIPTISEGKEIYDVLYVTKKVALSHKENRFRIASMKGLAALDMMRKLKDVTKVIIQGTNSFVYLDHKEIDDIINKYRA